MKTNKLLTNPRRILIVQTGNIGETVQTVPMLVALRTRFPGVDIAWLCRHETAKLMYGHSAVNRFIIAADNWYQSFSGILHLRQQLRNFAPEITLNVQRTLTSGLATYLSGAKYRVGKSRRQCETAAPAVNDYPENIDIADNIDILKIFGVAGCSIDFDLPTCEMDRRNAMQKLQNIGFHGNYAVVNAGAEYESVRWNAERFGLTAKYLLEQWNLPTLVMWSKSTEDKLAMEAVRSSEGAAILSPWFSSGELSAVLQWSTLLISSDAPLLHLGAALGTRCVGIYGPTLGTHYAPFGIYNKVVQVRHADGRLQRRSIKRDLIEAVDTELVCDICDSVLNDILQPKTLPMPTRTLPLALKKSA